MIAAWREEDARVTDDRMRSSLWFVAAMTLLAGCSCSEASGPEPIPLLPEPVPELPEPEPEPEPTDAAAICTTFLAARDPALADLGLDGGCIAAGGGAWQLETEVTASTCDEDWRFGHWDGRMRIRYVTLTGTTAALPWVSLPGCEAGVTMNVLGHHDWDDDGYEELAIAVSEAGPEDGSVHDAVWRFDGTALSPYVPAAAFAAGLTRAEDVDGDTRLDLVSVLPLGRLVTSWSADGGDVLEGDVLTLWHALPDGTFTRTDEVARAFVAAQCGAPVSYFSANDLDAIREGAGGIHASIPVVCARLRGVPSSEIRSALEAELADVPCDEPQPCYRADVIDQLVELAERTNADVRLE